MPNRLQEWVYTALITLALLATAFAAYYIMVGPPAPKPVGYPTSK